MVHEVPPVERARPGLWSVPVPIPNSPLGYTLVYLFETERGPVLVDSGWDDDTTWKVLQEGIETTGHHVADCYGVLVTHMHPDHHGLSGRVRDASGAWVAMHPQDAFILQRRFEIDDEWLLQAAAILLDSGAPEEAIASLPTLDEIGHMKPPVLPDRNLSDGLRVDVPGWDVRAIWTPGHSPGHTCFNVGQDVLLSGDHVLPEITPHIGLYRIDMEQNDPLGDYMHSLLRVSREVVNEVLPAHQHRFDSLPGRVGELLAHHEERLDAIEQSLLRAPGDVVGHRRGHAVEPGMGRPRHRHEAHRVVGGVRPHPLPRAPASGRAHPRRHADQLAADARPRRRAARAA